MSKGNGVVKLDVLPDPVLVVSARRSWWSPPAGLLIPPALSCPSL